MFILYMEKLSITINNVVYHGNREPIHISNTSSFYLTSYLQMVSSSRLKTNLSKSIAFYSPGTPQEKINNLTAISDIICTTSLDKYLGFPILIGRPKKNDFSFIIEKMQTRLATWKNRLLYKPGRLGLASSVLSTIPSYYMQINWLPQGICDRIDKTTRNFIWKDLNNKGIHLVGSWKISRQSTLAA